MAPRLATADPPPLRFTLLVDMDAGTCHVAVNGAVVHGPLWTDLSGRRVVPAVFVCFPGHPVRVESVKSECALRRWRARADSRQLCAGLTSVTSLFCFGCFFCGFARISVQ